MKNVLYILLFTIFASGCSLPAPKEGKLYIDDRGPFYFVNHNGGPAKNCLIKRTENRPVCSKVYINEK